MLRKNKVKLISSSRTFEADPNSVSMDFPDASRLLLLDNRIIRSSNVIIRFQCLGFVVTFSNVHEYRSEIASRFISLSKKRWFVQSLYCAKQNEIIVTSVCCKHYFWRAHFIPHLEFAERWILIIKILLPPIPSAKINVNLYCLSYRSKLVLK